MREYALIMLNILEYACIYLNKLSFEYVRTLNVSDAVHSIRLLYTLPSSYREREREREKEREREREREAYSENCQKILQDRRGFMELRHFHKHFIKNKRKKDIAGKHFEVFLLDTVNIHFQWKF